MTLIDAAAIIALQHMTSYDQFKLAVVSSIKGKGETFFACYAREHFLPVPLGDFVIQPCTLSVSHR